MAVCTVPALLALLRSEKMPIANAIRVALTPPMTIPAMVPSDIVFSLPVWAGQEGSSVYGVPVTVQVLPQASAVMVTGEIYFGGVAADDEELEKFLKSANCP